MKNKIFVIDKHSMGWEKPDLNLIPFPIDRPSTSTDQSENIAKIIPLLEKLEQHEGTDLDQEYILEICGKFIGDKGGIYFAQ